MRLMRDFYQLNQMTCGSTPFLSKIPCSIEWAELFEEAENQSLIGISFAGIEQLSTQHQIPPMEMLMDYLGQAE